MLQTSRTTRAALLGAGLILAGAWLAATAAGQTAPTTSGSGVAVAKATVAHGSVLDPEATAALEKMGAYLRSLQAFQVQSTTTREDVLLDGQKVQRIVTADLIARRPDRLRVEFTAETRHRTLFYDGKSFTMWADRPNLYATVPAPATIADLIDSLQAKFAIELPLEDLFHWGTPRSDPTAMTAAAVIGQSQIDGVICDHYAYRQAGLDWQIWIQQGMHPLPRRLVLTTTTDEARPQHSSDLVWNLAPSFTDATFTFQPPPGAQKIRLAEVREGRK